MVLMNLLSRIRQAVVDPTSFLLRVLAVIIALIPSCLIAPSCYELSMNERGENILCRMIFFEYCTNLNTLGWCFMARCCPSKI